jgi:hypothetical protein
VGYWILIKNNNKYSICTIVIAISNFLQKKKASITGQQFIYSAIYKDLILWHKDCSASKQEKLSATAKAGEVPAGC